MSLRATFRWMRVLLAISGGSQGIRCALILLLMGSSLSLAACGVTTPAVNRAATATAGAVATSTAAAQATKAATPVLLTLQVSQQGTLAAHNARLIVTVTVTNQANAPSHIVQRGCPYPLLLLKLSDPAGNWIQNNMAINCPHSGGDVDVQTIAAGGTWTHTLDDDVSYITSLRAGIPYTITLDLLEWHQGSLDASGHPLPSELQGSDVIASAQYTFQ